MGVPAFYRWLSERYPKCVIYAREDPNAIDLTLPNPNGYEFDNFYIDMNGLIHPCTHPEGEEAPKTEEDMFVKIVEYVEHLFSVVRPRKVLYLAIDGVAPRAKMNQQRSRRFRAAQEASEAKFDADKLRDEIEKAGRVPPKSKHDEVWDSNVITPGTPFMARLAERMREFIVYKQNADPAWAAIKVIFSDSQRPGEGEHKLIEFVRTQRAQKDYDPNTTHCLHGLDADLIMLGLATHELHFSILREEVIFGKKNRNQGYALDPVLAKKTGSNGSAMTNGFNLEDHIIGKKHKPLQILRLWVLREYLQYEFRPEAFRGILNFGYDFERCLDDFIFLCFFVGNDFLPHIPSLSIREGGLELIINLYKRFLPSLDGYLTNSGEIILERVEIILRALGTVEDEIFQRRRNNSLYQQRRRLVQNNSNDNSKFGVRQGRSIDVLAVQYTNVVDAAEKRKFDEMDKKVLSVEKESAMFDSHLKELAKSRDTFEVVEENFFHNNPDLKRPEDDSNMIIDRVKLGEPGWKDRYYKEKFEQQDNSDGQFVSKVVEEYIVGLCWVLSYYFRGCQSWRWYYPYHFAPFASDMTGLDKIAEKVYGKRKESDRTSVGRLPLMFEPSKPFKPYEQLLGVLPPASAHALPAPFHWYMTDKDSPIIDFYPTDFKYDPDGKGVRWLWVAMLPFVDETRLSKVMKTVKSKLSKEERKRNKCSPVYLFVNVQRNGGKRIAESVLRLENVDDSGSVESRGSVSNSSKTSSAVQSVISRDRLSSKGKGFKLSASSTEGVSGYFLVVGDKHLKKSFALNTKISGTNSTIGNVKRNNCLCVEFLLPKIKSSFCQFNKVLSGSKIPEAIVTPDELKITDRSGGRGLFVGNLYDEVHDPSRANNYEHNGHSNSYNPNRQQERFSNSGLDRSWGSMEPARKKMRYDSSNQDYGSNRQPYVQVQPQGAYRQQPYQQQNTQYGYYNQPMPAPRQDGYHYQGNSYGNHYSAPQNGVAGLYSHLPQVRQTYASSQPYQQLPPQNYYPRAAPYAQPSNMPPNSSSLSRLEERLKRRNHPR